METIKRFTDLSQAKKLAEILPRETADMHYSRDFGGGWFVDLDAYSSIKIPKYAVNNVDEYLLPCWSLAALLGVIRETIGYTLYGLNNVYMSCGLGDKPGKLETEVYDNEVDACYEMILKLNEIKIL